MGKSTPFRPRFPRANSFGNPAGIGRRVTAEVGNGAAASDPDSASTSAAPGTGSNRSTRHSRAHRSSIESASTAFSRLPFSSPTAAVHASPPGVSSTTRAGQPTSRPPLSLLRKVTVAVPPSTSPSPFSGCSSGPSPTRQTAPSCQMCHRARAPPSEP